MTVGGPQLIEREREKERNKERERERERRERTGVGQSRAGEKRSTFFLSSFFVWWRIPNFINGPSGWCGPKNILALTAIPSWHSLDYNTVSIFISSTHTYREHLYMKVPPGYDNDWGTVSLCKELKSNGASFPSMSFSSSWDLRPCTYAWLQTDARSSNITGKFTLTNFAHHWQFLPTQISRSASTNRVVILWLWWRCNVCRQKQHST